MKVEVIRESSSLEREVWVFSFSTDWSQTRAMLQVYSRELRATKRHKWRKISGYGYLNTYTGRDTKDTYPLPDGVIIEATNAFIHQVRETMGIMVSRHKNAAEAKT